MFRKKPVAYIFRVEADGGSTFLRNVGTYLLITRYQNLEDDNLHSPRREKPESHNKAFVINVWHDLMPKHYTGFSKYWETTDYNMVFS
jgi:hypothetical protein